MKSKILISGLITLSIIIVPTSVSAYVQVLGDKDSASEQGKRVDVNIGTVKDVKPGKIEIENKGKKLEIFTDKNTRILEKRHGKPTTPGLLKVDDRVAIFGTPSAASKSAHLLLVKPKKDATGSAELARRRAVYGLVREINGNILVISHPLKDDPRYKVGVIDTTVIKKKGIANPTISDIKVGDRVSAVGNWTADLLMAKKVHVIPGHAFGLLQKVATGSATPSATPSASP